MKTTITRLRLGMAALTLAEARHHLDHWVTGGTRYPGSYQHQQLQPLRRGRRSRRSTEPGRHPLFAELLENPHSGRSFRLD